MAPSITIPRYQPIYVEMINDEGTKIIVVPGHVAFISGYDDAHSKIHFVSGSSVVITMPPIECAKMLWPS